MSDSAQWASCREMMSLLLAVAAWQRECRDDERGQGLTEYTLLLVAIVAIVGLGDVLLETGMQGILSDIFAG